jgi:hypothetical protein
MLRSGIASDELQKHVVSNIAQAWPGRAEAIERFQSGEHFGTFVD